jgi:mannose/fructose-specific phosphotransferase system component IIA
MESRTVAIHAVEVFNHTLGFAQVRGAVWAAVVEHLADKLLVLFSVDLNGPSVANSSTQFMKKHPN